MRKYNDEREWQRMKQRLIALSLGASAVIVACLTPTVSFAQSTCFLGEIRYFAGSFAPRGWALVQGQTLSIPRYAPLYSILGNRYGGDGVSTFKLPDLRSRTAIGTGTGPGLPAVLLTQKIGNDVAEITGVPSHTHNATTKAFLNASPLSATSPAPAGKSLASPGGTNRIYRNDKPNTELIAASSSTTTTIDLAGPPVKSLFTNVQPSLSLNPIICLVGSFPKKK